MKLLPRLRKTKTFRRTTVVMTASSRRDLELLELRNLLSAGSLLDVPIVEPSVQPLASGASPQGYSPAQIKAAYQFNSIVFNGSVQGDGSGQTIAIVDAYNDPNIAADLRTFDAMFGLADPPSFKVINQSGGTSLPATSGSWSQEIALDVEWAHAMAPGASIVLVEASSSSISDLLTAVNTARNLAGVSVVSMSWGASEFSSEKQYDSYFTTPAGHTGVTFIASAGDNGAQALWPAISPNVLSVGGTSLTASSSGYGSESAWSASGGGTSRFESRPSFQASAQSSSARTSPDVSYNANPNTGFAVYDSLAYNGRSGWFEIGGTSAGAPQWAALLAIANQGRALAGEGTLSGAQANVYRLPSTDFHDITAGSNGNSAKAGYDLVTGLGTPVANLIVHDLVANSSVSTTPTSPTQNPTSPSQPSQPTAPRQQQYLLIYWNHHWWLIPIGGASSAANSSSPDDPEALATVNAITVSASLSHDGSQSTEAPSVVTASAAGESATSADHTVTLTTLQSTTAAARCTDTLLASDTSSGNDGADSSAYINSISDQRAERILTRSQGNHEARTQVERRERGATESTAKHLLDELAAQLFDEEFADHQSAGPWAEVTQSALALDCDPQVVDLCFSDASFGDGGFGDGDWSANVLEALPSDQESRTLLLGASLLAAAAGFGSQYSSHLHSSHGRDRKPGRGLLNTFNRRPRRQVPR